MLCDPKAGACELSAHDSSTSKNAPSNDKADTGISAPPIVTNLCSEEEKKEKHFPPQGVKKAIKVTYFTDPICSSCWGIEPQLRKLKLMYGADLEIAYHMGGLLPSWEVYNSGGISKPSDVAQHWDSVSQIYQMPISGKVWLEDPLHSSYPPSIAFKAAQLQDEQKALVFLRKLREMLFLENKNITRWRSIQEAALYARLDPLRLEDDFNGSARRLFEDDLQFAKTMGVRGFPTLFFQSSTGQTKSLYGVRPFVAFEKTVQQLDKTLKAKPYQHEGLELFGYFSTLCSREFAELKGINMEEARNILTSYHQQHQLELLSIKNGDLWRLR